jgi:hypothetical protein
MSEAGSLGMKWRSREAADELVREFEASGLIRKLFCEQRGLSLGTLDLYRKRRRLADGGMTVERFQELLNQVKLK